MGTEYYIIKPSTKEKFYLGKNWGTLEGIRSWCYTNKENYEGDYTDYECFRDFLTDIISNCYDIFPESYTWQSILDFLYEIYDFIQDKVYIDNDCSDNTSWTDYKEIDYKSNHLAIEEEIVELIELIPKEKWILSDNVINEIETIREFIKEKL